MRKGIIKADEVNKEVTTDKTKRMIIKSKLDTIDVENNKELRTDNSERETFFMDKDKDMDKGDINNK